MAGIWDMLTQPGNPAGLAGNPLFMAGLNVLGQASSGQPWAAGLGPGIQQAQMARQNAVQQQFQQLQMAQMARAWQQKEQREQAMQGLLGNPALQEQLGPGLMALLQADPSMASQLVGPMVQQRFGTPGTPETLEDVHGRPRYLTGPQAGRLVFPHVPGKAMGGAGETLEDFRKRMGAEFDLSKIPPEVTAAAEAQRSFAPLQTYLQEQAAGAGPEDTTRLAFYRDADKKLGPYTEVFNRFNMVDASLRQASGVADVMTLYNIIKILDPASVVMPAETALVQSAEGLWRRIEGFFDKQQDKGPMTGEAKAELAGLLDEYQKVWQRSYAPTRDIWGKRGERLRFSPEDLDETLRDWRKEGSLPDWGTLRAHFATGAKSAPSRYAQEQGVVTPSGNPNQAAALAAEQALANRPPTPAPAPMPPTGGPPPLGAGPAVESEARRARIEELRRRAAQGAGYRPPNVGTPAPDTLLLGAGVR